MLRYAVRTLAICAGIAFFAWATARAIDVEHARAGMTATRTPVVRKAETVQGKGVEWWHRRAVQARKDANKRGLTIRRLRGQLRRGFVPRHWELIGWCESRHTFAYNGSSGFDGWVQFHPGTWTANRLRGYPAFAWQASPFQQLVVAELVLARQGWGAWPSCSRRLGLR